MQLVRKAMETSTANEQLCQDFSSEESGSGTEEEEEADKENEMEVDSNERGHK